MKRRRAVLIAVACLVAVVVAFFIWPGKREPEYQGKKLSEWLLLYSPGTFESVRAAEKSGAPDAIRHIGTNALPYLLKWIAHGQSTWKKKAYAWAQRHPAVRTNNLIMKNINPIRTDDPAYLGMRGFSILGNQGASAIPELVLLADDNKRLDVSGPAMQCLCSVNEQGRAEVEKRQTNPDTMLRITAATALQLSDAFARSKARARAEGEGHK